MASNGDVFYLEPHPHPAPDATYDENNTSLETNVQNLRLTATNLANNRHQSGSSQGQGHGVTFNDLPTGVTREVVLSVDPKRHNYGRRASLCEVLFGIVPGFFGSGESQSHDKRIMVQGLLPAGEALKAGIKIGEWLMSVNEQTVNFDNIDSILAQIHDPQHVNLVLQKIAIQTSPKPIAVAKEHFLNNGVVAMVTGEKAPPSLDSILHGVLFLDQKSEVLYKYPESKDSVISECWGAFMTLSHVMPRITDQQLSTSTILYDGELLHVIYHKEGERALVVYLPAKKMLQVQAQNLVADMVHVLHVCYGTLNCAFLPRENHARLEHYLRMLFVQNLLQKELLKQGARNTHYMEPFFDTLPAVRGLVLPEETKMVVNNCLSELEAMEFVEMSEAFLDQRRMFSILGTCLFYKGYLVCSHMGSLLLEDVAVFLRHHAVLTLCHDEQLGQVLLWREIFPKAEQEYMVGYVIPQNARHFLLVVGMKNLLLCVVLETGGIASPVTGPVPLDTFYVDQAKAALLHMESHDVLMHCRRRLEGPSVPSLACVDWFSSDRTRSKRGSSSSTNVGAAMEPSHNAPRQPESILKKPYPSSYPNPNVPTQKHGRGAVFNDNDSDLDTMSTGGTSDSSFSEHRVWGTRQESDDDSILGLFKTSKKRNLPNAYDVMTGKKGGKGGGGGGGDGGGSLVKLPSGCDNTLFHYVHVETASGVFVCPTQQELRQVTTPAHNQLLANFHTACLSIRSLFQRQQKSLCKHKVREHGVCFQITVREEPVTYWVVGRVHEEPAPREFFVCFHDSAQQNAVELAFKLAYGTFI